MILCYDKLLKKLNNWMKITLMTLLFCFGSESFASWKSLEEEYALTNDNNSYMYPIDVSLGFTPGYMFRHRVVDKTKNPKAEAYKHNPKVCMYKGFGILGLDSSIGLLIPNSWCSDNLGFFPHISLLYKYQYSLGMNLEENGYNHDFIFTLEPITKPTDLFELSPRLGIGVSLLTVPLDYYPKTTKEQTSLDENGNPVYEYEYKPAEEYIYDGVDLALLYDLVFRVRIIPELTIFTSLGIVYHPMLKKKTDEKLKTLNKKQDYEEYVKMKSWSILDGGALFANLSIGCSYVFAPAIENPEQFTKRLRTTVLRFPIKIYSINGLRHQYRIVNINNKNDNKVYEYVTKLPLEYVGGIGIQGSAQFSRHNAFGLGAEIIVDMARKSELMNNPNKYDSSKNVNETLNKQKYANITLKMFHSFIYNRITFDNAVGVYIRGKQRQSNGITDEKTVCDLLFIQPSINVHFLKYLFIGFGARVSVFPSPLNQLDLKDLNFEKYMKESDLLRVEFFYLSFGFDYQFEPKAVVEDEL